jgi:hypothetical protein
MMLLVLAAVMGLPVAVRKVVELVHRRQVRTAAPGEVVEAEVVQF